MNVPKTKKAFCKGKECRKHTMHKVTQYKTGKASLYAQGAPRSRPWPPIRRSSLAAVGAGGAASQNSVLVNQVGSGHWLCRNSGRPAHSRSGAAPAGKRRYDRKQSGYGGQTKPVFHKKVRPRAAAEGSEFFLLGGPTGCQPRQHGLAGCASCLARQGGDARRSQPEANTSRRLAHRF